MWDQNLGEQNSHSRTIFHWLGGHTRLDLLLEPAACLEGLGFSILERGLGEGGRRQPCLTGPPSPKTNPSLSILHLIGELGGERAGTTQLSIYLKARVGPLSYLPGTFAPWRRGAAAHGAAPCLADLCAPTWASSLASASQSRGRFHPTPRAL
nr:galectin-1 isoform X2 [Anas platyrhynchos]|eukprot:XP_027306250.1 galectin-1 isoform X2 [Anas platyrhynchos]